ncbi:ATP-dependent helicase [Nocardia puris]|uniref:ATP-dependent helicase n=1 Tax=Nocardia puris TaxID=208602 RepID=UPI002B4B4F2B|nr:ATP-dependent DNA helicase [Nocardia puris]
MRSDSAVRLVRRNATTPRARIWGADVRALFDSAAGAGPRRPGWQPWQVLGGPGTGKTALLVDLAAGRVAAGENPESVLVLTHSKRAAREVRDAVTARLTAPGSESGGVPGATREPLVRTLHSYAFSVLRRHAAAHGNPPPRLLTGAEQDAVLRELLRGDLEDIAAGAHALWPERLQPALGLAGFADQLRDLMLRATERGLGPEDLEWLGREHGKPEWEAAGRFAARYEQTLLLRWSVGVEAPEATAPALDAAELIGAALDALAIDANLLAEERARIRYLLVDDAQHLDPQAALLVRVIGAAAHTAVVAGDPDQAVFAFRGADLSFAADPGGPEERRIVLRRNHRSGAQVRLAVSRVAAELPGSAPQRPARLAREQLPEDDGTAVRVRVLATPAKEAALIADHLRRAHLTAGVAWSDMAVIVRSVPLSLAPLRRALLAAGVPVHQPAPDVPLARRRGAAWMLLALRALLAGERADPEMFTAEDALDLLSGPLGGADQIALRRLRRGLRRGILEAERAAGWVAPAVDGVSSTEGTPFVGERPSAGDASPEGGVIPLDDAPPLEVPPEEDDVPPPDPADERGWVVDETEWREDDLSWGLEPDDRVADDSPVKHPVVEGESETPADGSPVEHPVAEDDPESPADGSDGESAEQVSLLDRSSAEVLRELLVGGGDRRLLERLTDVEAAPLRRVLTALERARAARGRGAGLEDVLWALWRASRLERRWVAQSERGGAVGMQADRDLDAAVRLFDAAAAYVDRLPRAGLEGFVEYLLGQEIPQDGAPVTAPGEAVELLSAHAAAGREWDVVAIAGVQEGIWPNPRPRGTLLHTEDLVDLTAGIALTGEPVSRTAPILAEERRLLLVACSRARRSLLVTAVESVSGERDLVPSRFLSELLGHDDDTEPGALPVTDPGRALVMHALVAELRGAVCDPESDPERRSRAARELARLAYAGVPGTHPEEWYGTADLSSHDTLWDDEDSAVALSPSTVDQLRTCPLRWALERHGGTDGDNRHAVQGNLVHTLVQALAGKVPESQVRAALDKTWRAVDPGTGWHSRQELRRTEAMLETFLAWVRNTRGELTQAGVEVPVDCVLPARAEDERPVRIRGRVDRLERDAEGRYVIVDVKTGKNPITKQAAADHAQLATYQVAAAHGALDAENDGAPAESGAVAEPGGARLVYVAKPSKEGATERTQDPLGPDSLEEWRETIHEAAAATKGPSFLAMRNDGCRHCAVAGSCPVQDTGRQVTDE